MKLVVVTLVTVLTAVFYILIHGVDSSSAYSINVSKDTLRINGINVPIGEVWASLSEGKMTTSKLL